MSRAKIIGISVLVGAVVLFFVSPQFRNRARYLYDSLSNWRYRATQQMRSSNQAPGGAREVELAQRCRNNMRSIETAKRALLSESGYVEVGARVTYQDIAARLGTSVSELVCPKTGEAYRLGGIADEVSCSVGTNGTPTIQADDHIIGSF